jgi:hypothetical protein
MSTRIGAGVLKFSRNREENLLDYQNQDPNSFSSNLSGYATVADLNT